MELVRSLFDTLPPTTIMGGLFIAAASMAAHRNPGTFLDYIGAVGIVASLIRIAIILIYERRIRDPQIDLAAAHRIERAFAASYLAFAAILGLFAATALRLSDIEFQIVVAALVVGYAAGVATGISLRPWIAIPAAMAAVLPTALSSALTGNVAHIVLALILVTMLAGGIGSMATRYRSEIEKIAMRHAFASLARTDYLTGLANRLALSEAFTRAVEKGRAGSIAVHCLDLDRFKHVNDELGHPIGDLLLQQVGKRLCGLCNANDVVGRLGGDEFVLLQIGMSHLDNADLMARRIVRALTEPYAIDGHRIVIGVSVGYAIPEERDHDLGGLLGRADVALYRVKHEGGGGAAPARADEAILAVATA